MVDTDILTIGPVSGIWALLESALPASEWLAMGIHKPSSSNNPKRKLNGLFSCSVLSEKTTTKRKQPPFPFLVSGKRDPWKIAGVI